MCLCGFIDLTYVTPHLIFFQNKLYEEAKSAATWIKKLIKLKEHGKFGILCTISRAKFHDVSCDTGSEVSILCRSTSPANLHLFKKKKSPFGVFFC